MDAFPNDDKAQNLKDLAIGTDIIATHRSLGMMWDLTSDVFKFDVSLEEKPYTRRGVLSTINSIFDPIGFAAPVIIQGKLLLRKLMMETMSWDETLPEEHHREWDEWKRSLSHLKELHIPRAYIGLSLGEFTNIELHIFSDASEKAIAAVAYIKVTDNDENPHIGFVLGKAKVAPSHGHTIPRLELCAAVLAVEIAEFIVDNLDVPLSAVRFFTDSKIVLGYIYNQTRRFYIYVGNRVERIRKFSTPDQWSYVPTNENPADLATRCVSAAHIGNSIWLQGSSFLTKKNDVIAKDFPLTHPDDVELRPIKSLKTDITQLNLVGSHRFERFSTWRKLVTIMAQLQHIARSFHSNTDHKGWHICFTSRNVEAYEHAEQFIIKQVQREIYAEELRCIANKEPLPKRSTVRMLDPTVDANGLLRIGGRLDRSAFGLHFKKPIIIPGRHHIATLLVRHYHEIVKHQGRHFTEGAIRDAGLWIVGGKRLISSVLHKCIPCRKLRGKQETQKMSNLPPDRLTPNPPFTYVGVDTFGPWTIVTRRTRGGQANSKRWAIMFTCLTTRAIHIEVVEDMSSSAFINALRRFVSVRGKVKNFRSDRGTNFIGSTDSLQIEAINVEDGTVKDFLYKQGTTWMFNPPHSSHMGGVWERMIGVTRRILDSVMTGVPANNLTHDVLTTFMAEVSAIVNARPIIPVSTDPEAPFLLSPSTLLTQKTDHVTAPSQDIDIRDMYKAQWKRVQVLAEAFWRKWQQEYLHCLQTRRKWQDNRPNIKDGDIVLLKEKDAIRNYWPLGIVINAIKGSDNRVRKVVLRVMKDGVPVTYTRPISEIVLLLSVE